MEVSSLQKPANRWCAHCTPGQGCSIYDARPAQCRDFACVWLESQSEAHPLPAALRPDKSKIVLAFGPNRRDVMGSCDPGEPDAWKAPAVMKLLKIMSDQGLRVMFGSGRDHYALDRGRVRRVELAAPNDAGVRRFVRFLEP
ncbi:MAG TPA: hypothetical protein VHY57_02555 [Rhizomicrobium sp.]|nr:hypothetical protein [Rhizomicrobium sp.]